MLVNTTLESVISKSIIKIIVDMLELNMRHMKARNMEELSKNLREIADSIKDGYTVGVMRPGCIWKVDGEVEEDNEEKVFQITFKSDVWIKSKSKKEAVEYFESLELLSPEALELGGEVSDYYEIDQCNAK